jgi:arginine decarboxylase
MSNKSWTIKDANTCYHIDRWGDGYFKINEKGELIVHPEGRPSEIAISVLEVIKEALEEGVQLPVVLRFHDILRSRVRNLNRIFKKTITRLGYQGVYRGVYPIKVNQMREVVEEIIDAGEPFQFGLEAGSKAELLSVLAYNTHPQALTILNGYKDDDYMRLAMIGRKLQRSVIVVVEQFSELKRLVTISKEMRVKPLIGFRAKMTCKSIGRWASSSGEKAKFGLNTTEILRGVRYLKEEGLEKQLCLLHFHIGSQIPDIRAITDAVSEGIRIYVKLHHQGIPLEYFDVGGGLGIDYDGSRSSNDSSRNYSIEEYAQVILSTVQQICDTEKVSHPNIVTESGRALTAHHSCVIAQVVEEIRPGDADFGTEKTEGEHPLVDDMRALLSSQRKSIQARYNEAQRLKDEIFHTFTLGLLSLEDRAKMETLYWRVLRAIHNEVPQMDHIPEEIEGLTEQLSSKYLCNFSVFQSTADVWAIRQLLPICPIHRLEQKPTYEVSLVDITCDSDGKIDQFIGENRILPTLPLHEIKEGEPYYLGVFLTGAYQDVMGDMHNLFGRINEVHVYSYDDDQKNFYIEEVITGHSSKDVLSQMQYTPQMMATMMKKYIDKEISNGTIFPREGIKLIDFYDACLESYTYLNIKR